MISFCFVLAPAQNEFFFELVAAVRDELERRGVPSTLSTDGFPPPEPGLVYVLCPPHEYYRLEGIHTEPTWEVLKRTVFLCAEQPGSSFFDDDAYLAARAGAVLDINRVSVAEFRRRGIAADHFPLGWTPTWSRVEFGRDEPPRVPIGRGTDVLHLGIVSERRCRALAGYADDLSRRRCRLILGDDHGPNRHAQANFAVAEEKWRLLCDARVLLNIHVADRPYFEWLRVVQAICAGALVVSEHSTDTEPLAPGVHFLSGDVRALGLLAQDPLDFEERRWAMARDAWWFLRDELPLARSIDVLMAAAERADANPLPAAGMPRQRHPQSAAAAAAQEREQGPEFAPPEPGERGDELTRAALKDLRLQMLDLRREMARREAAAASGREPAPVEVVGCSDAWAAARPRVSVITPLYNHARHIAATLDSCLTAGSQVEHVVVDDGSTDGSREAAERWMAAHPDVPMLLVTHPVNRGLGHARNTALDFARGELVFMLDADNTIYPHALPRLTEALDADPGAAFAYGMLERFDAMGPVGLASFFPWRPERLRAGNYIDAMAMWRAPALAALGGYSTDLRLHGWEDYDLWARAAEAGERGAFVPEILARYRVSGHSMLTITDISDVVARSVITERSPRTMSAG